MDENNEYHWLDFILKYKSFFLVSAILILGFLLRFWGTLQWGHGLVYHPDEVGFIRIIFEGINFDYYFGHPQFYPSILKELFFVFKGAGYAAVSSTADMQALYAIGRMFGVIMDLVTIAAVFFISKKLFNSKAGYLASFLVAITPLHIWNSHYMYNDVPLTAFLALTLLFSMYIVETAHKKWYVLAGLSAAFAMGMKHPGWIALFIVLWAHLLHAYYSQGDQKKIAKTIKSIFSKKFWSMIVLIFAVYAITNIGFIVHLGEFITFITGFVGTYAGGGANLVWYQKGYAFKLISVLPYSMGLLLYLAVIPGFIYAFKKRTKYDVLLLGFFLLYFLYVGSWSKPFARLMLPIIPLLLIWGSRFYVAQKKKILWILLIVVIAYTLIFSISTTARFSNDTRDQATQWIYQNIAQGSSIASDPEFYSPKLSSDVYMIIPWIEMNLSWFEDNRPDYVIITSEHDFRKYPTAEYGDFRKGKYGYKLFKTFKSGYFNQGLYTSLSLTFEGYPVSPTIEIYKKN